MLKSKQNKNRIASIIVGATILLFGSGLMGSNSKHSEDSLLTDWSVPPPWPVFIALNVLAGVFQSMADALTPPPVRMINIAFDYQRSQLAQVCKEYKIADFLGTGPKTVDEIAAYTETEDGLTVERIMYAMASIGITKLDPSLNKGDIPRFVNTPLSATLRLDHPNSAAGMVGHVVQDGYMALGHLDKVLGPNPIGIMFDQENPLYKGGDLWGFFEDHPEREEQFTRAMQAIEGLGGNAMAEDFPFGKFKRVVDIGGSLGHFAHKILARHPTMNGVLVDRANVVAHSKAMWYEEGGQFNDGAHERLDIVDGDFFDGSTIPRAQDGDVYLLRYILHDWDDEACLRILRNIRENMKGSDATLLIGESAMVDRDNVAIPHTIHSIDLLMMDLFGRAVERTPAMWKELLTQAGFRIKAIHPTRSLVHFVEAVPTEIPASNVNKGAGECIG